MTSIVNFEERMKSTERTSDTILEFLNLIEESKRNGVLPNDLLSKILVLEGKVMSNQVGRGLKTEEQAEDFLAQIPNGKYNCFNYPHKDLDIAYNTVKQDITAALFDRENLARKSQPVKRI